MIFIEQYILFLFDTYLQKVQILLDIPIDSVDCSDSKMFHQYIHTQMEPAALMKI